MRTSIPTVLGAIVFPACGDSPTDPIDPIRAAVASVTVAPSSDTLSVGGEVTLQATAFDSASNTLTGRTVMWATTDPGVASVNSMGLVTARGTGLATISATIEGVDGTAAITVTGLDFQSVYAGRVSTCALDAGGTAYCWGENGQGRLGTGAGDALPRSAVPLEVAGGLAFQRLSLDYNHACAVDASGAAHCWGGGGALGQGTGDSATAPVAVLGALTFGVVATGSITSCGVAGTGLGYCWGFNFKGQLGDGSTSDRFTPTPVAGGLSLVEFALGVEHSCGLVTGGAVYCWGAGDGGQLGVGTPPPSSDSVPQPVSGGRTFTTITAGENFTCGLEAGGAAFCWGLNTFGQLGTGTMGGQSDVPVAVTGGISFDRIDAGFHHVCALQADGTAYCWGWNLVGRLGSGDTASVSAPTAVSAGTLKFSQISGGDGHTCAMTTTQVAYCWGLNSDGQIGDGTQGNTRLTPTPVTQQ